MMRGERLKEIREAHGLSQQDLADRIGIHVQQIYRIETSKSVPNSDTVARLAKELEVSADYLLGLVDSPTDRLQESDLSPMERLLISAVRRGLIYEALDRVTTLTKEHDQPVVSSDEEAVDSNTLQSGQTPVPSNKSK